MRQVNGDMDDLFRRASERYPLRTDSADWDRLANALDHEPEPLSDRGEDKRRRRGVFWWFLLLPLGGLGYLAWHSNAQHALQKGNVMAVQTNGAARQGGAEAVQPAGAAGSAEAVGSTGSAGATGTAGAARTGGAAGAARGAGADGSVGAAGAKGATGGGGAAASSGVTGLAAAGSAGGAGSASEVRFADANRSAGGKDFVGTRGAGSSKPGSTGAGSAGARSTEVTGARSTGITGSGATDAGSAGTGSTGTGSAGATGSATMTGNAARELLPSALDLRRVPMAGDYDLVVNVKAPGHAADSLPRAPKKAMSPSKTSHGYIGIFGAPDFSTVKFQTMKGVGTTFGVLLGYSFNDRWAVETGVYLDRKRYYTQGEYFNTKNVATNYNTLLNVDGTCNMWEIPLNVRYNFNTSERMKWFATAGLSTYLMSNESYDYQALSWPGGPVKDGYWNIKKPSQYFFSVVNLSAGFEQRIGKIGSLRLEPYVRLPLSGIGTGRLPIMSAGLNIGITRRLW